LRDGLDLLLLRVLGSHYFTEVDDLFLLITDDLVVLVSDKLLLLFEVLNDLAECLLEYLHLAFEKLNSSLLCLSSLIVLIDCSQLEHVSPLSLFVLLC
jgi:hypothetical protein